MLVPATLKQPRWVAELEACIPCDGGLDQPVAITTGNAAVDGCGLFVGTRA